VAEDGSGATKAGISAEKVAQVVRERGELPLQQVLRCRVRYFSDGVAIGSRGFVVDAKEYFLPYSDFPWFREARVEQILDVVLLHGNHLLWPQLDVDLCLDALAESETFPLVYAYSRSCIIAGEAGQ